MVCDAVAGLGPLQRHLDDPTVEEIWINERVEQGWSVRAGFDYGAALLVGHVVPGG